MTASTALQTSNKERTSLASVDPIAFSNTFAIAAARMCGSKNLEDGKAVALTCWQENLTLLEFGRRYHIIQGKPTMRADAMLAEFRQNHGGNYVVKERSEKEAKIDFTDRYGNSYPMSLTWQEAESSRWPWVDWKDHAKGLKDSWATPLDRRNMLFARLVSDSLRAIAPELVAGVYEESELTDAIEVTSTVQHQGPAIPPGHVVKADGEIVPGEESEDAEFQVKEESSQSDDTPPFDESVDFKFATARQVKRIEELRDKLSIDADTYASILSKRGVDRVSQLSSDQADEIIQRMESKLSQ